MLKLKLNPDFTALVKVRTDALSGDFTCTFKAYRLSEVDKLNEAAAVAEERPSKALLRQALKGWTPFELNGELLDYNAENFERVCDLPGVEPAMLNAFYRGHAEATTKN